MARRAGRDPHELLVHLFCGIRKGLLVALLGVADEAVEGDRVDTGAALPGVMDVDGLRRAVHQHLPDLLRKVLPGRV